MFSMTDVQHKAASCSAYNPCASEKATVTGKCWRFTILTSKLIRMEYAPNGVFEDRATQLAVNRAFPPVSYRVTEREGTVTISTDALTVRYNGKPFTPEGLSIELCSALTAYGGIWHYGDKINALGGTCRTLDKTDGAVPLKDGLMSRNGFSVIDDSGSATIGCDGTVSPRSSGAIDVYFFGYSHNYAQALYDYYRLSGFPPALPRFALGAWWSKFHRYSHEEYQSLIARFKREDIPFSVAVLDMDWHITDIPSEYGSGWTGYTWNRSLFPDPQAFLAELHKNGMHVTLNEHPAAGVRPCEAQYKNFCTAMGMDSSQKESIPFDAANTVFMDAYFRLLHDTEEEHGVDFWWIDWQQTGGSSVQGIDPLWMLNRLHFLNNQRSGKRALILSRYAGLGSHRYPVGFSGDTHATWNALHFQPYFTAAAADAGFGWWSHDIGGHMHGIKSDELAVRWVQFGVFSPIFRIHGSDNPFNEKEPWHYPAEYGNIIKRFIRLRHALVPYLHTMNIRYAREGMPLITPLYYSSGERNEAYEHDNEYRFGNLMIAAPITTPMNTALKMGKTCVWLPEGMWYDFFSAYIYKGNRTLTVFRPLDTIPVFVCAGAIVPLVADSCIKNDVSNPEALDIRVYCGRCGSFIMIEDDGLTQNSSEVHTIFTWNEYENKTACFDIHVRGTVSLVPQERTFSINFIGIMDTEDIIVDINGKTVAYEKNYDVCSQTLTVMPAFSNSERIIQMRIAFQMMKPVHKNNTDETLFNMLRQAQITFDLKDAIWRKWQETHDVGIFCGELAALEIDADLNALIIELLTAY